MADLFLLVWFYLYSGLMFGMVSNAASLFPKWGSFWQVTFWPIFFCISLFNQVKDSSFGWFIRYQLFKAGK